MSADGRDINQSVMPAILWTLTVFRWCYGACGLMRVACCNLLLAPTVSERGHGVAGIGQVCAHESLPKRKSTNAQIVGVLP